VSEPFPAFNFLVEIQVPGIDGLLCGAAFAECRGLEIGLDVRAVGEQRLLAGAASYGRVTLRRGMTPSFDLWDWCAAVLRDRTLRADAVVIVLGPEGENPVAAFRLRGCLPTRLRAPALDARVTAVAIEELELACESVTLVRPGEPARPTGPTAREQAELIELQGDRRVAVQINPQQLRILHGAGRSSLSAELWFEDAQDVRRLTEPVAALTGAAAVRFQWGSVRFDGRIESVAETLDVFAPDGRPRRAQLALVLAGA
jgi:phage tail-like protein